MAVLLTPNMEGKTVQWTESLSGFPTRRIGHIIQYRKPVAPGPRIQDLDIRPDLPCGVFIPEQHGLGPDRKGIEEC